MDKNDLSYKVASKMLEIGAVKFNFEEYFTWTSGIKSPIYCDNRASLSNHNLRSIVRNAYAEIVKEKFPNAEVIAGVATGAIAQGVLVADKLNLPFVYIREKRKEHGLKKIIEGDLKKGQKMVIIEDHVSTGGSGIRALEEAKKEGADVLGVIAAFSYGFPAAISGFERNNCELHIISTFLKIKNVALEEEYITKEEEDILNKWYEDVRLKM